MPGEGILLEQFVVETVTKKSVNELMANFPTPEDHEWASLAGVDGLLGAK